MRDEVEKTPPRCHERVYVYRHEDNADRMNHPHSYPHPLLHPCSARFQMRLRSKPQRDATHSIDGLDRALTALHVLGSVVQTVPVVGESLKSATEIATDICETVKARVYVSSPAQALNNVRRK
jgi:hypothetical protein